MEIVFRKDYMFEVLSEKSLWKVQHLIKREIGYWDTWEQEYCKYDKDELSFSRCYTFADMNKVCTLLYGFLRMNGFDVQVDQK